MQILIKPENIEQAAKEDLSTDIEPLDSDLHIVDQILQANQESSSLDELQDQAWDNKNEDCSWKLEDGLLLWKDWLFIPDDDPELQTWLLDEVHSQVSTAHLGQTKTQQLVKSRYYWPTWRKDVEWYVWNCNKCQHMKNPWDKMPGLLNPLPIPKQPWQHISMDF